MALEPRAAGAKRRRRSRRWIGTFTDVHDVTLAAAALKDADRRKDEFLATLAHELRNPLSPMRIAVTLLGRRERRGPRAVAAAPGDRTAGRAT